MAENLLIVESPSKAKTLKKYLGPSFEILASYGHVRDLVPKTGAVDTENDFAMQYQLVERNEKHVDAIARAVKACTNIFLATDPDREGEAIAWHLAEILKSRRLLKGKTLQRVVFYEITQSAVRAAVANPREIMQPLVNAQQARRALDYLVGFNLSPLLWKKIRRGLSAGRVQSPALRLIVERELEIRVFKAREYWTVHLDGRKDAQGFRARLSQLDGQRVEQFTVTDAGGSADVIRRLTAAVGGALRQEAPEVSAQADSEATAGLPNAGPVGHGGQVRVIKVDRKRKQRQPAPPFTTSTLQQESVRKLGFTTDRTMKVAQQLYEGIEIGGGAVGLISYMRTDSVALSGEAVADIRGWVGENFAPDYLPGAPVTYVNKSKNAQEAHEAIRPTSIGRTPASLRERLNPEQLRLYEMIWKRTVASQMSHARFDTVSIDLAAAGDPAQWFRASGQTLVFPGFMAVYQEDRDDSDGEEGEARLPAFEQGEVLDVEKIFGEQHFTQPPPRYTEASLVKALEEHGIGRPSTYASIISTLQQREYVTLDKKRFQPTDVGEVVNKFLTEHFSRYVDYEFTARMEDQLDVISEGKAEWVPVLKEFWLDFSRTIEEKEKVPRGDITQEVLDENCPKCGLVLTLRLGRRGRFVGCSGYPECDYTRNLDGTSQASGPTIIGVDPATSLSILLLSGPYGPYLQLGEAAEEGKKPKRISLPKNLAPTAVTVDIATRLLSLPRDLGLHPESGKKVVVNIGRFGPYIQHDGGFRSIPRADNVFDIALERALAILAEPKAAGRGALRVVGNHPEDGASVTLHSGRYGNYVKHGKVNATLPEGTDLEQLSMEEAVVLLAARSPKSTSGKSGGTRAGSTKAAGTAKSRTKAARDGDEALPGEAVSAGTSKPAAKKVAPKTAAAKKSTAKKPAAKKPAAKKVGAQASGAGPTTATGTAVALARAGAGAKAASGKAVKALDSDAPASATKAPARRRPAEV
jgi:DNA topoisomerase-1